MDIWRCSIGIAYSVVHTDHNTVHEKEEIISKFPKANFETSGDENSFGV
jgi:hypothetical protein